MKIFVTDEGIYWNHENPILERYADCVVVVCLNGKKVTDKYECFVSPYKHMGLGVDNYGVTTAKFQALKSVEDELRQTYSYHGKLLFLADNAPQSLYPYLVLKDNEEYNSMHLWCMPPYRIESRKRKSAYYEMLHDLSKLHSFLCVDSDMLLAQMKKPATMADLHKFCSEYFMELLPKVVYEINKNLSYEHRYYYDMGVGRYIETEDAFNSLLALEPLNEEDVEQYHPFNMFCTLGLIMPNYFPNDDEDTKAEVCQPIPRIDGKQVCEILKNMRRELAAANGIDFETVNCPSIGPCAGTCMQCDKELKDLQDALMNIPEEERVYPRFRVSDGFDEVLPKAVDLRQYDGKNNMLGFIKLREDIDDE